MVTNKLKELEATRAKLAELETSVAADMRKELAGLPAQYGFDSVASFVKAVQEAAGKRRGGPAGSGKRGGPGKKRRSRAVITDETRASVKKLVGDGKTGGDIAKALGISLPSVQNIKKALGLVQGRKPKGK